MSCLFDRDQSVRSASPSPCFSRFPGTRLGKDEKIIYMCLYRVDYLGKVKIPQHLASTRVRQPRAISKVVSWCILLIEEERVLDTACNVDKGEYQKKFHAAATCWCSFWELRPWTKKKKKIFKRVSFCPTIPCPYSLLALQAFSFVIIVQFLKTFKFCRLCDKSCNQDREFYAGWKQSVHVC